MTSDSIDIHALMEPLQAHRSALWEDLPDLELYMDQVITYLDRQLSPFQSAADEKLMTAAMINNYVKSGLIPRPTKKKYTRTHMARLLMAGSLKQVLPIRRVKQLLDAEQDGECAQEQFNCFCQEQDAALSHTAEAVGALDAQDRPALYRLALRLAIQANTSRLLAERLLAALEEEGEDVSDK